MLCYTYFVHIYFITFLLFYFMNFLLFISTILFILVTHFPFPLFCLIMYFVRSAHTLLLYLYFSFIPFHFLFVYTHNFSLPLFYLFTYFLCHLQAPFISFPRPLIPSFASTHIFISYSLINSPHLPSQRFLLSYYSFLLSLSLSYFLLF